MISNRFAKSVLRKVWASVPDSYATLRLALTAEDQAALAAVSGGTIQGTSANGHSVQYATGEGMFTAQDIAECVSFLLDLYDTANAVLISSGVTAPTDAQLYAEMIFRLPSATIATFDNTNIRC